MEYIYIYIYIYKNWCKILIKTVLVFKLYNNNKKTPALHFSSTEIVILKRKIMLGLDWKESNSYFCYVNFMSTFCDQISLV